MFVIINSGRNRESFLPLQLYDNVMLICWPKLFNFTIFPRTLKSGVAVGEKKAVFGSSLIYNAGVCNN
jgi:hypothetical protein